MWNLLIKIVGLNFVSAQTGGTGGATGGTGGIDLGALSPLKGTFLQILERIVGFLIAISIPIAAILIIWGGFTIMTAGGSPEKVDTGKKIILYAVVGFIIVLVGWSIVTLLQQLLGVPTG